MRDAHALRDGAEAHAFGVSSTDGSAPSLFGLGALAGEAAKVCGGHLARSFHGGAEGVDRLGTAGIVERGRDTEGTSLVAEAVVRALLVPECGRDLHGSSFVGLHAVRIVNGARYVK